MIFSRRPRTRGFTLVELLVVIGIIAVLIGILLPVLGRVREQGRSIGCQANIRSILQALFIYAADNKGSLPHGFIWNRMVIEPGPGRNGQSSDPAGQQFSFNWASQATKVMNPKTSSAGMLSVYGFAKVFKCPSAEGRAEFIQPVHYGWNHVAMPTYRREIVGYGISNSSEDPRKDLIRPARLGTDTFPETALIWDQPLILSFQQFEPVANTQLGFDFSFIDGGQLLFPQQPSLRYRDRSIDYYQGDPYLSWGFPINTPTKEDYSNSNTDSVDPGSANTITAQYGQIGVPRWRHNNEKVCNVGFADGSVKPLTWSPKRLIPGTTDAAMSDFMRSYIMLKWPKNRGPEF